MAKNAFAFRDRHRKDRDYEDAKKRARHSGEFVKPLPDADLKDQVERCTDCGTPTCHTECLLSNFIPDWNGLAYKALELEAEGKYVEADAHWHEALNRLHSTNNFPEWTGRICPAFCESGCTQSVGGETEGGDDPVTIKTVECAIADKGWEKGWILPQRAPVSTGKEVVIIGAGPAGLACAQELARAGHSVTVYEKNERGGGLLRFGIPDSKIEKHVVERRINQLKEEGVKFKFGKEGHVGETVSWDELYAKSDAVVMAGGAENPRNTMTLDGSNVIPGREELDGIHYAMEFLPEENRYQAALQSNDPVAIEAAAKRPTAAGKHVIVIGGGDTGSDCISVSNRHEALSIVQLEILSRPPDRENKPLVWPNVPRKFRESTGMKEATYLPEGFRGDFLKTAVGFVGENGHVTGVECVDVEQQIVEGRLTLVAVPNSLHVIPADLVLLAMGFLGPKYEGMVQQSGVALTPRSNVKVDNFKTSDPKVYAAGDMEYGQSLVMRAIRRGRDAARVVDEDLVPRRSDLDKARRNYPRGSRERYFEQHPEARPALAA